MNYNIICGNKKIKVNYNNFVEMQFLWIQKIYLYLKKFNDNELNDFFEYYKENVEYKSDFDFESFYLISKNILHKYNLQYIKILYYDSGYNQNFGYYYITPYDSLKLIEIFITINNLNNFSIDMEDLSNDFNKLNLNNNYIFDYTPIFNCDSLDKIFFNFCFYSVKYQQPIIFN